MIIDLNDNEDLTLHSFGEEGLTLQASRPDLVFGPMEMLAVSLGLCTFSVLAAYGEQIGADSTSIEIHVRWQYSPGPFRVEPIEMDIDWKNLPQSRRKAAERAAEQCTIHHTLSVPTTVFTRVTAGSPRPVSRPRA